LSTYFKKTRGVQEQEDFQTVLRAAGETETTQENIQDWLQLDEGDPGLQLLTEEEIAAVIFFYLSILISIAYIIKIPIFFCLLGLSFVSLIRMTSFPLINSD
jgi:hypothetical protein